MSSVIVLVSFLLLLLLIPCNSISLHHDIIPNEEVSFLGCLQQYSVSHTIISAANSTAFTTLFNSTIQNPRITAIPKAVKPHLLLSPTTESDVRSIVICARKHDVQIRLRSGGHDYEGLSYISYSDPFVLVDLGKLRSVSVNTTDSTVWVQSGAQIGELYYTIAEKAGSTFGFPAGTCPTIGVGGHFAGGGIGSLVRSHGLSSDNIVDARLVNADGEILDRESMGEDLFWAIRGGGGGGNFGVILAYKVKLVQVPPKVTVFNVAKTLDQGLAQLLTKWQHVAPKADERLFVRIILMNVGQDNVNKTVMAMFNTMFLGPKEELLPLMQASFPELGLGEKDCMELSWVNSTIFFSGHLARGRNLSALLERGHDLFYSSFKAKSDFVREPIPEESWERILSNWFLGSGKMISPSLVITPLGGPRMDAIPDTWSPFPHRKGNLYEIQYLVRWGAGEGSRVAKRNIDWSRRFYEYMAPYVSKNPRAAYSNYRDLDLGSNYNDNAQGGEMLPSSTYQKATVWGNKYFGTVNFRRMASIKAKVDPQNFFRNEQSVPPLHHLY